MNQYIDDEQGHEHERAAQKRQGPQVGINESNQQTVRAERNNAKGGQGNAADVIGYIHEIDIMLNFFKRGAPCF